MSSRASVTLLLLLPALGYGQGAAHGQEPGHQSGVARVVVVGDIHGAYSALIDVLAAADVIDTESRWAGGTTRLVSLGDLLDRGPDSRAVLDLVMRLQDEAAAHGGRVDVVVGNHELMNLIGDLRYVTPPDYAAFAADETDAMREAAYGRYAATLGGDVPETRAAFENAYPRGYFARREAFSPRGRYGAWLLSLQAIVVVGDTAFVHGGLPAITAEEPFDAFNAKFTADLRRYLELREQLAAQGVLSAVDMARDFETAEAAQATTSPALAPVLAEFLALATAPEQSVDGPLWYRGSVYCKPLLERPIFEAAIAQLAVERVVVGHTPTGDRRARSLYDGKLIMLDTGMLAAYYNGRPAALVIEGKHTYVQYASPPERAVLEQGGTVEPYPLTETELVAALMQGTVTAFTRTEDGSPWPVTLTHAGEEINAAFFPPSADSAADLELAAAALDDLLGVALVAPTVPRTIEGEKGALQLRHPRDLTETERLARQLGFTGWCPIEPQANLMRTFDLLLYNRGRTFDNIIYSNDLTDLLLTDHRRAFGTERALPTGFDPATLAMPAALSAALRTLDEPKLHEVLGDWVDTRRIRALLARRDRLLESR
jgi:hypothetical protein